MPEYEVSIELDKEYNAVVFKVRDKDTGEVGIEVIPIDSDEEWAMVENLIRKIIEKSVK